MVVFLVVLLVLTFARYNDIQKAFEAEIAGRCKSLMDDTGLSFLVDSIEVTRIAIQHLEPFQHGCVDYGGSVGRPWADGFEGSVKDIIPYAVSSLMDAPGPEIASRIADAVQARPCTHIRMRLVSIRSPVIVRNV